MGRKKIEKNLNPDITGDCKNPENNITFYSPIKTRRARKPKIDVDKSLTEPLIPSLKLEPTSKSLPKKRGRPPKSQSKAKDSDDTSKTKLIGKKTKRKDSTSKSKTSDKIKKPRKSKKNASEPEGDKSDIPENKKKKKDGYFMMTSRTKLSNDDCEEFLKGECPNKYCKNIHNFSLKNKEKNNQEFAIRYQTLKQDFMIIEPYERKHYSKNNLDLMFIMDCTGSMSSWIETAKKELKKIIEFIKENNPYSKVRISFVGYRDICDEKKYQFPEEKLKKLGGKDTGRFTYLDFSEDADTVKEFISLIKAFGGGDFPEDIPGGLKIGLEQKWESEAKFCVLVCDAPCHGKKYHSGTGDEYPDGDPNGLVIEDLIQEYGKRNINFYAVKIGNDTDKMYNILSNSYHAVTNNPIVISKMGHSTEDFAFFISQGASNTLTSVTINGYSLKDFLSQLKNEIKSDTLKKEEEEGNKHSQSLKNFVSRINTLMGEEEEVDILEAQQNNLNSLYPEIKTIKFLINKNNANPKWKELSIKHLDTICHSYYISKDRNSEINWRNPLINTSSITSQVLVDPQPFAEGELRYAFYMHDLNLEQNLVAKIPKEINSKDYTLEKLSKDIEAMTICHHLSGEFNERIINFVPDTKLLLNFVNNYIYEVKDDRHQFNYYSTENFIDGYYEKYNNNSGWINQNKNETALIAQAFTHFSWQMTKGYLMIVDLQGVGGVLTDPQINCLNIKKFGKGNLGYMGIMKFFMSHMCNSYCRKLDLIHPRNKKLIDKDFDFFVERFIPPTNDTLIWKLCDLCKKAFKKGSLALFELRKKCWEALCDDCDSKRKESMVHARCSTCNAGFVSSSYWFKMKRLSFPDKCMKCRLDTRMKERQENEEKEGEKDIQF